MNDGTRNLYIYGAQSIAHGMACALRARGCAVAGYVVTERGAAPAVLDGLPVHEIGELRDDDAATTFLLAVPPYLHDEIRGILAAHGYHHATGLDPATEYREMAAYLRGKGFPSFDLPADGGTGVSRETEARDAAANSAAPRADAAAQALAAAGIAIYVACSAADPPLAHARPESPMYHTVQAGAALSPAIGAELRDDTGGNISRENPHCDELTVTYWAWKNRRDPVKGIAHYRRYLAARPAEYAALLDGTADALLPLPFVCWPDTATQYSRYNAPEAVAAMHAAIAAVHPARPRPPAPSSRGPISTTTTCSSRARRSLTTTAPGCSPSSRTSARTRPRFSRRTHTPASAATSASSCTPST